MWFNESPRTDVPDTSSDVAFPNPSAAHQTPHRLGHPFTAEDEPVGLHGFSLGRFCRDSMEWLISWPGRPHHHASIDVIGTAHDLEDCAPQRGSAVPPAKPCSPGLTPPVHCLSPSSSQGLLPPQAQQRPLTLQIHLKPRLQEALAHRPP